MNDDELIDGYFQDSLSPEEVARLEERLKADPALRERYRRYAEMIYGMETLARTEVAATATSSDPVVAAGAGRFVAPWVQIAAACVITGILASTASAWYAERKQATRVERFELLRESFEATGREVLAKPSRLETGAWRADGEVVEAVGSMPVAADGGRYVRLEPHERRKLSYLDGVIDLREAQARRIDKGAKRVRIYCRVALRPEEVVDREWVHYRLRMATFTTSPENTAEEWRLGPPQFYGATYSHRAVRVSTGRDEWHVVETTVDVPEDVQAMVLSISASANGEHVASHLVDDMQAELIFEYDQD